MNKLITLLIICFLFSTTVQAQFWSEDFSTNVLTEGWTTEDANPGSNGLWEHCSEGAQNCPPYSLLGGELEAFESETASNGFMFMDSWTLGSAFLNRHISRLTSAAITDCIDKDQVFIEFETFIITRNNNAANNVRLRIWADGAWYEPSFRPFPSLFEDEGNNKPSNPAKINFDISHIAALQDTIYIQWEWVGKAEFALCIDDVYLYDTDPTISTGTIWYERFDEPGAPDWERDTIQGDSAWAWDSFGYVGSGLYADAATSIASATANDGAMVFNADLWLTGGTDEPLSFIPFVSELISPTIDLSDITVPLSLKFTQLVHVLDASPGAPQVMGQRFITSYAVSTDGGESWGPPMNANECLGQNIITNSTQILPLDGVEGEANVKIKFTWAGNLYYWVLDDIAIIERANYDMQVNRNFFSVLSNLMTPQNQMTDEAFLADISNVGAQTAENVELNLQIRNHSTGTIIYDDTNTYGDLPPNFLAENVIFNERLDTSLIQEKGVYQASYTVRQDSTDGRPANDKINWKFEITDSTFSKELGANRSVTPAASRSFTYGNVFYIPNGLGYKATSLSFAVGNADKLGEANRSVNTYLIKLLGDFNNDSELQPGEYVENPLAFNSYSFTGDEASDLITIPIGIDSTVALEDDTYYMLLLEYVASTDPRLFIDASDTLNYQASWFVSDSLQERRFVTALDVGNTGTFSTIGFGYKIVPVIRLNIRPIISDLDYTFGNMSTIEIYPNPVSDILQVDIKENIQDMLSLRIVDAMGRQVFEQHLEAIRSEKIRINTKLFPPGTYFIEIRTNNGFATKPFMVSH